MEDKNIMLTAVQLSFSFYRLFTVIKMRNLSYKLGLKRIISRNRTKYVFNIHIFGRIICVNCLDEMRIQSRTIECKDCNLIQKSQTGEPSRARSRHQVSNMFIFIELLWARIKYFIVSMKRILTKNVEQRNQVRVRLKLVY